MITLRSPILAASLLPPDKEHTDDVIFDALLKCRYPVMATLKKDGIRALRVNGDLLSRTFKKIPNKAMRLYSQIIPGGFDMELWNKSLQYNEIESIVMSQKHEDTELIQFHVLDWITQGSYAERVYKIMQVMTNFPSNIKFSPPVVCENAEQLMAFFKMCEEEAGEGMCFRTPASPYKQDRSTLKEQYLVKLSRYVREEAVIVGFVEQQANTNSEHRNAVGKMDRSSMGSGMVGKNTLGAFVVQKVMHYAHACAVTDTKMQFTIGTGVGLTNELRQIIWDHREEYLGKVVTYKTKPHGKVVKPRSPIWVGFREEGY